MKRISLLFLSTLLISFSLTIAAQSPDKILKQAVRAMGGEKNFSRIRSWQAVGKIKRQSDLNAGSYQSFASQPDSYAVVVDFGGLEASEAYNGKSGWRRDSREGLRTLTGQEGTDFRAEALFRNNRWFDAKKEKARLTLEAPVTTNGVTMNVVALTTLKGVRIKMFFDAVKGLLLKEEIPSGASTKIYEYSDYRIVDGVLEPFAIAMTVGEEKYDVKLDQITHNTSIARTRFDFPQLSNQPLPDVAALLEEVKKNQTEIDRIRENYGFTQVSTNRVLDDKGKLQEKDTYTHEISFYRGHRLHKLVEKNGKPLTPDEEKKNLAAIEKAIKRIDKIEEDKAKKKTQAEAKKKKNNDDDDDDDENASSITDMLQCSKLLNPRHETFRKRDMIVFDFEPGATCNPKTEIGKMAQKLKLIGAFWIDPVDKQIARLEMRLGDSYKIGGGMLASIKSGSALVFEQERVNNEIWLPTYQEINIAAKIFLFKGLNANSVTRYRDYKKFNVEAEKEKLKLPDTKGIKP